MFRLVGVPPDMKNYFRGSSMEEMLGNAGLGTEVSEMEI
jgi:hypothetical protein